MFVFFETIKLKRWSILILSTLTIIVFSTPHWLIKGTKSTAFLHRSAFSEWQWTNFFTLTFDTKEGISHHIIPNIIFVMSNFFNPAFLAIGFILLFFMKKKDFQKPLLKIIIIAIILYKLLLAGIPFQDKRHLLLDFPLVLIILYPAFERLMLGDETRIFYKNLLAKNPKLPQIILIITFWIHLVAGIYLYSVFYKLNKTEQQIANTIKQYPSDKKLYITDMEPAMKSYRVGNKMIQLFFEKNPNFQKGELILFNEKTHPTQFAKQLIMQNWNILIKTHRLTKLNSFEGGYTLYMIQ